MAWLVRADHVISSLHRAPERLLFASVKNRQLPDDESTLLKPASILVTWRLNFGVFVVRLADDGSITSLRHHRGRAFPLFVPALRTTVIVPQKIAEHSRLSLGDIFEVID